MDLPDTSPPLLVLLGTISDILSALRIAVSVIERQQSLQRTIMEIFYKAGTVSRIPFQ